MSALFETFLYCFKFRSGENRLEEVRKNPLLSRLKAALIDLEAAIPEEAVETKWMPRREAWV
ncbi:MAG: hypothetical protein AAF415_13330, partial [Pseudomonadota bacterium]